MTNSKKIESSKNKNIEKKSIASGKVTSKPPYLFSSYAKMFLTHWPEMFDLIRKLSSTEIRTSEENETHNLKSSPLLSDQELFNALNGPFQILIKQKINAYAEIARIKMYLTIANDELLKSKLPVEGAISDQLLKKITLSDLKKLQTNLSKLAQSDYDEWVSFLEGSKSALIEELHEDVQLNESEMEAFGNIPSPSEITSRFKELKLTLPKIKRENYFEQYLKNQLYLVVHSALSRQHLPHDHLVITNLLKKLEPLFKKINKEREKLEDEQLQKTEAVVGSVKL